MARKAKTYVEHEAGPKKRTSIGQSIRSRPKNKHKRRSFKKIQRSRQMTFKELVELLKLKEKQSKKKKRNRHGRQQD